MIKTPPKLIRPFTLRQIRQKMDDLHKSSLPFALLPFLPFLALGKADRLAVKFSFPIVFPSPTSNNG